MRDTLRHFLANFRVDWGLAITGAVLLAFAGGIVAISLPSGGSDDGNRVRIPTVHPAQDAPEAEEVFVAPDPTATAPAARVARVTATPEPRNRQDCGAIRGTEYRSVTERAWFLQRCVTSPTPAAASAVASAVVAPVLSGDGAEVSPTDVRPTEPAFSSATAITWASGWLLSQAPLGMEIRPSSCVAGRTADIEWLVGCLAEAPACVGASCVQWLSGCLIEVPLTIWLC